MWSQATAVLYDAAAVEDCQLRKISGHLQHLLYPHQRPEGSSSSQGLQHLDAQDLGLVVGSSPSLTKLAQFGVISVEQVVLAGHLHVSNI